MLLELSMENAITLASIAGGGVMGLWMRSVSAHNKLSEHRSESLEKDILEVKKEIDDARLASNEIREALQNTRESYVTNARFEKFTDLMSEKLDAIMYRFDAIMIKLESKPDKQECKSCIINNTRRQSDYETGKK